MTYEMVIGLETHVELKTATKIFCACKNAFGDEPNANVCPVCMGLPGALPALNARVPRLAALAGIALNCTVNNVSRFDRKSYFYPDLPKGYQISQFYRPICERGALVISAGGREKRIGITRLHIEEDAGKLDHELDGVTTLDMNRCGAPLIEIVTEPCIHSAEEAVAYLRALRLILVYTDVSDCKMNEGSLRCDVNISVRREGEPLGERTEIKNLNSFQSVERAINAEYARQAALLDSGVRVTRETHRYDQKSGKTYAMRRKEDSADYRYFPDPDLPAVYLSDEDIAELRQSLPTLPHMRRERLMSVYGLTAYAAEQLTTERWLCDLYEAAAGISKSPETLANLIIGECFALMAKRAAQRGSAREESDLPLSARALSELSDMIFTGEVNSGTGKQILAAMYGGESDPRGYARRNDLLTLTDEATLNEAVSRALERNPAMLADYLAGKASVEKALMGKAMAETHGRADPRRLGALLRVALEAIEKASEAGT